MEVSHDAICGLMGIIIFFLFAHLVLFIWRELRDRKREREIEDRLWLEARTRAKSNRIEEHGQENRWDKTLGMVENLVTLQNSQIETSPWLISSLVCLTSCGLLRCTVNVRGKLAYARRGV